MEEYLELKQFLLRRTQRAAGFVTLYILLVVSGEVCCPVHCAHLLHGPCALAPKSTCLDRTRDNESTFHHRHRLMSVFCRPLCVLRWGVWPAMHT